MRAIFLMLTTEIVFALLINLFLPPNSYFPYFLKKTPQVAFHEISLVGLIFDYSSNATSKHIAY